MSIYVDQGTQYVSASDRPAYAIQIKGATTITAATTSIYKNGSDVTSTNMTGTSSISGTIINLPTCISLVGGNTYIIACVFTADGVQAVRKIKVVVQKDGDE